MTNLAVLNLACRIMRAHNETCGYETFKDISLNSEKEEITFNIANSMLSSAFHICDLLNLTLCIEAKDSKLEYAII